MLFYFSSADTSLGTDQEQEKCGDEVEEFESVADDEDDGPTDEDDSSTKGDKNVGPENNPTRKRSKTADAIARDKAAKRKTAKMSNKQAVLQSSESLAYAIKEMAKGRDEQRKSEIMLWLEHESKEKAKDRELEKMKLEAMERDQRRKFELEMMRLNQCRRISTIFYPGASAASSIYSIS